MERGTVETRVMSRSVTVYLALRVLIEVLVAAVEYEANALLSLEHGRKRVGR